MASRLERIRKMQESMEKLRGEYGVEKASARKKKPAKKKPVSKKKTKKENKFSVVGLAGKILKRGKQLKESVK